MLVLSQFVSVYAPCPYLSSATVGDCSFGSTTQQNRIIIETMAGNVWENDDDLRLDRLRQHFHFYCEPAEFFGAKRKKLVV